jgi:thiamine pyrophosphate-dependent acetolactate synthase large subunit-like protein
MVSAMNRRDAVKALLADRGDLLVVTGLGSPSYDCFAAGDDDRNFYLWAAMGGAAVTGLGLALAQPDKPVLALTGDGEMLMGVGSLATIAVQRPANLTIAVLDNEHYGETGMQKSHTGNGVDLAGIAEASGFAVVERISDIAGIERLRGLVSRRSGPVFANIKVAAEDLPRALPPKDGVFLTQRFRAAVTGELY